MHRTHVNLTCHCKCIVFSKLNVLISVLLLWIEMMGAFFNVLRWNKMCVVDTRSLFDEGMKWKCDIFKWMGRIFTVRIFVTCNISVLIKCHGKSLNWEMTGKKSHQNNVEAFSGRTVSANTKTILAWTLSLVHHDILLKCWREYFEIVTFTAFPVNAQPILYIVCYFGENFVSSCFY